MLRENTVDVKSNETDAKQLLSELEKITGHGDDSWRINVKPVTVDNSAPLDYITEFRFTGTRRSSADAEGRIVRIEPSWSDHPKWGEPDEFLGYRITDTNVDNFDGVYAEYVTFSEAIRTVGKLIGQSYGTGTKRVREWRKTRRHETVTQRDDYEELRDAVEEAMDEYVSYVNEEVGDDQEEFTEEELMAYPEIYKQGVLGQLKRSGAVEFVDLAFCSLVVDELCLDAVEPSGTEVEE